MTDKEILTALITIKRGIYSKPIKTYIDTLISDIKSKQVLRAVDKRYYNSAMSYHITQQSFTYGQKNSPSVDVNV